MTFSSWLAARQPTGDPTDALIEHLRTLVAAGRLPADARWRDVAAVAGPQRLAIEHIWSAFEIQRATMPEAA